MTSGTPSIFPTGRKGLKGGLPWWVRVRSGSMKPLLWPGTELEIRPCAVGDLRIGDVVCLDNDEMLVHRLVSMETSGAEVWVLTQGDRCPEPDPHRPADDVLGRVSRVTLGHLALRVDRMPGRAIGRILGRLWPLLGPVLWARRRLLSTVHRRRVVDGR